MLSIGVGAGAGGLVTYFIYMKRKERENKARAERLALSVKHEVEHIQELLGRETLTAIQIHPYGVIERLPSGVYDGLLNSAAISDFDTRLQDGLYDFYKYFKDKHIEEVQVPPETLAAEAIKVWDALDRYVKEQQVRFRRPLLRRHRFPNA